MTLTDFFYWLGDVFEASFRIIEKLEMTPNIFFIIAITVATCAWVWRMSKYRTEAKRNNTLE
jgi:hypothetical protein